MNESKSKKQNVGPKEQQVQKYSGKRMAGTRADECWCSVCLGGGQNFKTVEGGAKEAIETQIAIFKGRGFLLQAKVSHGRCCLSPEKHS